MGNQVNSRTNGLWTAKHNPLNEQYTGLPETLDWRNVEGQNFVSPVDDQGGCGSCYSFASMGMMESRIRVQTNNQQQPIFSEQEIITCGRDKTYNQGCVGATMGDGGQTMMEEMQNGPLAVGFMVLDDFRYYDGGIYVQSTDNELKDEFNPFVPVNHAVLAVGYGTCTSSNPDPNCDGAAEGTPYWIVKNSWGTSFGDQGFFYILRGVDEVGIESIVVKADVVPQM